MIKKIRRKKTMRIYDNYNNYTYANGKNRRRIDTRLE